MHTGYETKQKGIILDRLAGRQGESFSPKELHALCAEKGTPVGLATVYRQLERLTESDNVKRLVDVHGSVRYEYAQDGASFCLRCDICGRLTHADCSLLEEVAEHMSEEHGFRINTGRSVLYGRCRECG